MVQQFKYRNSMKTKTMSGDWISVLSTQCDSSEEREQDHYFCKTNPLKHKTELCKTFSELGYCNYGYKCRFAHGRQELIQLPAKKQFRRRRCNGFWKNGYCLYGIRCQFGHNHCDWESQANLSAIRALQCPDSPQEGTSRLLALLPK